MRRIDRLPPKFVAFPKIFLMQQIRIGLIELTLNVGSEMLTAEMVNQ